MGNKKNSTGLGAGAGALGQDESKAVAKLHEKSGEKGNLIIAALCGDGGSQGRDGDRQGLRA